MALRAQALVTVGALMLAVSGGETAFAEKSGGIIKIGQFDSPAGMSILEESSYTAEGPMMGVFNNLVLYDQHEPQNSLESVRPDLATGWLWDESRTLLTLHLRHGVQWHDGKPFTAADVKRTWDLLQGGANEKLRLNPRKPWYRNVQEVTTSGDDEVTFHLQRPQPALLALLGASLSLPCQSTRHAPAPGRHRPLQICRIQAERGDPGNPQPGLLEAGPALPRRHRVPYHQESGDPTTGAGQRRYRYDPSIFSDPGAAEGGHVAGAAREL